MSEKFDAIIIGSGIGGLTAAAILTRLRGARVLILEKHYVAGGLTHEFHRNQFSWDTGIHYVGGMAPGEQARMLFDLVTGKQVEWNPMPDVFDKFVFPDLTIDVPKNPKKFAKNLIAAFPEEKQAIRQYFRDLEAASNWYIANFLSKFADPLVRAPFALKSLGKEKLARMTTRQYMDRSFKNNKLKAVLVAQWGDYGLTPDRSSFAIHALVVWGYCAKTGAFFPEGGGRSIAGAVEKIVGLHQGRIQLDTEATAILVRDGAAYGVNAKQSDGRNSEYHADIIISNAGAELTFRDLVPVSLCQSERGELAGFQRGTSSLTLYLGLSQSPAKFGITGENYWIYETFEMNNIADCVPELIEGKASYGFVSFPSMKNTRAHAHTAEVCVFVDPGAFAGWADRPNEYYLAKEKIMAALLALLERHFPGFGEIIGYAELSTPLTIEHFTSRPGGEPYGIPAIPARFDLKSLSPRTPVKNLYLSGSDVCSLGIAGALYGGVAAAACAMGPMGFMRIMIGANIAARKPTPSFDRFGTSSHTISGSLVSKKQKAGTVYELQIEADRDLDFRPGQHIDLQVTENDKRSYSVLDLAKRGMTLVIDTKPQGPGSLFVKAMAVGDTIAFSSPKGTFLLDRSDSRVCFISTGTGMVPLLAMLRQYLEMSPGAVAPVFLFGTGTQAGNYMPDYIEGLQESVDVTYCLSRDRRTGEHFFDGRITRYLKSAAARAISFPDTDFYICGNPDMVRDVQKILRARGAGRIFVERY